MFFTANIRKTKWVFLGLILVVFLWFLLNGLTSKSLCYSTDEERAAFLLKYGYQVVPVPVDKNELTLPKVFDEIYQDYAQIQKENKLDFERYKGKAVTRYTYKVLNYPGNPDDVFANVFVYKDKIIAADIFFPKLDGFIHGLNPKTGGFLPPTPEKPNQKK